MGYHLRESNLSLLSILCFAGNVELIFETHVNNHNATTFRREVSSTNNSHMKLPFILCFDDLNHLLVEEMA